MSSKFPNRYDSLFRTGMKTSEKFKSEAEEYFEKKRKETQKKLQEEVNRRTWDDL